MLSKKIEYTVAACSALIIALILSFGSAYGQTPPPKLTSYVTDLANVLNPYDRSALSRRLEDFNKNAPGHPQVVVLIVPSLNGADLDAFTNDVFHKNQIGQKNNSNGILTVLAMAEHRSRMEVGYDLEPTITDATSKHILDSMAPDMKAGNVYKALNDETSQIFPLVSKGSAETQELHGPTVSNNSHTNNTGFPFMSTLLLLIILGVIAYFLYKFLKNSTSNTSTPLNSNNAYRTDNDPPSYTPNTTSYRPTYSDTQSYTPPSYTPPTYNPPSYTPPQTTSNDTGSTIKSAVAGGLAGAAASEFMESTRRRRRDDDDNNSGSSSSWGSSSSSDYGSSSSSSSSSDSGSSWSSGSSDSGFSGGGGDSGGGGSDSSW